MLILGLCQRPGVLQPGPVLPPQTERVQLRIDGAQQLRKVQAPAGEEQGKILRLRPATLQHGGTGVVEGVVGGVVLRLPAALYQHAIAAGLLGGVVEDHRRVFAPLCGAGAEHGVIQVAEGRRPLSGGGFCRHGRHSLRQRRRIRQDAQPLFRRQRVGYRPHRRLIQHRPRPVHVQRQRHRRRAQAEGGGLQHAGSSPQQGKPANAPLAHTAAHRRSGVSPARSAHIPAHAPSAAALAGGAPTAHSSASHAAVMLPGEKPSTWYGRTAPPQPPS